MLIWLEVGFLLWYFPSFFTVRKTRNKQISLISILFLFKIFDFIDCLHIFHNIPFANVMILWKTCSKSIAYIDLIIYLCFFKCLSLFIFFSCFAHWKSGIFCFYICLLSFYICGKVIIHFSENVKSSNSLLGYCKYILGIFSISKEKLHLKLWFFHITATVKNCTCILKHLYIILMYHLFSFKGSTFSKAKPGYHWTQVTRKGILRVLLFPVYWRW